MGVGEGAGVAAGVDVAVGKGTAVGARVGNGTGVAVGAGATVGVGTGVAVGAGATVGGGARGAVGVVGWGRGAGRRPKGRVFSVRPALFRSAGASLGPPGWPSRREPATFRQTGTLASDAGIGRGGTARSGERRERSSSRTPGRGLRRRRSIVPIEDVLFDGAAYEVESAMARREESGEIGPNLHGFIDSLLTG